MITLASSSGKTRYNIKEYYLDTPADLTELMNMQFDEPGSKARIISSGEVYVQNSLGQWILQPAAASGGGGGGDGAPGVSIVAVSVNEQNHLICTMSNGSTIDAGEIKTQPGASITLVKVNDQNHLIVTLSDNTTIDAGLIPTVGVKTAIVDENNHLQITLTNSNVIDAGEIKTLNGKSAYEVAKANGYTGTETEWLNSLKGEKGTSITSLVIDKDGHLICVLNDGTTIDTGQLPNGGGIVRVATFDNLPTTGKIDMLYLTIDTGKIYYWDNEYKTATTQVDEKNLASNEEIDNLFPRSV